MANPRSRLLPSVVFPLYERFSGSRVWSEAARLAELQWRSADELQARALEKLRTLLVHAGANVPYYRELFMQAGFEPARIRALSDLAQLPATARPTLRANSPDRVMAETIPPRRCRRMLTGGSSGYPLEFFWDRAGEDSWLATALFFLRWAGIDVWDTRVTITSASRPVDAPNPIRARLTRALRRVVLGEGRVDLVGTDLSVAHFLAETSRLSNNGRYFIRGYASYLARLASELIEQDRELSSYPKAVITHADTLTLLNATTIQRAFHCPVVNQYSAWEVPQMAQTCPDNTSLLHVNDQRAILRVVHEDGSDVAAGDEGRILVTDLTNYAMPFINYDIGDWATLGPPCPCGRGFPTIERLQGRTSELLRTPAGKVVSAGTFSYFLIGVHRAAPYISEYQAVQTALDQVILRVVPTSSFSSEYAEALGLELETSLGPDLRVRVEPVQRIPTERSGKRLLIKSELLGV